MDKNAIMDYLGLDQPATVVEVQAASLEKLKAVQALAENMDTPFLAKMHQKNLDQALLVNNEVMKWNDADLLPSPVAAPVTKEDEPVFIQNKASQESSSAPVPLYSTAPVIIGSKSKSATASSESAEPLGWLIRHTENQTTVTFSVFAGKNYIGRKKQPSLPAFILIEEDVYISRIHAMIEAYEGNEFEFYISDNEMSNLGKASKNGTYINGNETRITGRIRLSENDTIQIGLTKMILKINRDNNLKKVIKEVQSSKFMDTVIIDAGLF